MESVQVKLRFGTDDDRRDILKAIHEMTLEDVTVTEGDAPFLEVAVNTDGRPLYKVAANATEQALARAREVVRGAKNLAGRPDAAVELQTGMWPGMGR